jgi:Ca2+-binding EF-hand superfamily protein
MTASAMAAVLALGGSALAQQQNDMDNWRNAGNERQSSDLSADGRNALFAAMDDDGDGTLSKQEYVDFVSAAANISRSDAIRQFSEVSGNDGKITLAELATTDLSSPYGVVAGEVVSRRALFSAMDDDSDGYVTSSEYANFMSRNLDVAQSQARDRFRQISGSEDRVAVDDLVQRDQAARLTWRGGKGVENRRIFAAIDTNRDGYISEDEYVTYATLAGGVSDSDARQRFQQFASNEDRIDMSKFDQWRAEGTPILLTRGGQSGQAGMSQLFAEIDQNGDNQVTRQEYLTWRQREAQDSFDRVAGNDGVLTADDMPALHREWAQLDQ